MATKVNAINPTYSHYIQSFENYSAFLAEINENIEIPPTVTYNGGYIPDEDPADYIRTGPIKAVILG